MQRQLTTYPKARSSGLLVEQAGGETIIYDEERRKAHSLNRAAALVWHHCDGRRSIPQLGVLVGAKLGAEADETIVRYAIEQLAQAHLLEGTPAGTGDRVTRRDVVKRMAVAGAAIAIPAVLSIAAPTPMMAASSNPVGEPDPGPD